MFDLLRNKIVAWCSGVFQNKKSILIIGFSLVIILSASIYFAKDAIFNVFSSQEKFLSALFSEKFSQSALPEKKYGASAPKPAKECFLADSQEPSQNTIILSEIAWMGNKESANNEWIELKNISFENIEIGDWQLVNDNRKIKVVFSSGIKIPAGDFYVLERGGANFLPDIKTDAFFTGALKNTGGDLYLFDKECNLIDRVLAASVWPAGNNKTKKTMERNAKTLAWHNSLLPEGTPHKENTSVSVEKSPATTSIKTSESLSDSSSFVQPSSPLPLQNGINYLLISEIMIGTDSSNNDEFIEFYNSGPTTIDLTGFTIKKKTSTGTESSLIVFSRLKGKFILPGSYFLAANEKGYAGTVAADVMWPGSYMLADNNSLVVYDNLGRKVEQVSWTSVLKGQSYQRDSWTSATFHVEAIPSPKNQSTKF